MAYPKTHEKVVKIISGYDRDFYIVDLACGKGEIITELRKLGFKNIKYCDIKKKFDDGVDIMDLNNGINYPDNSFDLVIATEMVEHMENKYFFFREIRRILKDGGTFIFTLPNLRNIFNRLYYLFTCRFIQFNEKEIPPHMSPPFFWEIPSNFVFKKVLYNRGYIPILRIPFVNIRLFAQTVIIESVNKK